jgi:hypothetical protein
LTGSCWSDFFCRYSRYAVLRWCGLSGSHGQSSHDIGSQGARHGGGPSLVGPVCSWRLMAASSCRHLAVNSCSLSVGRIMVHPIDYMMCTGTHCTTTHTDFLLLGVFSNHTFYHSHFLHASSTDDRISWLLLCWGADD